MLPTAQTKQMFFPTSFIPVRFTGLQRAVGAVLQYYRTTVQLNVPWTVHHDINFEAITNL